MFDGEKKLSDGVIATGSNFVIENFDVQHYVANGVVAQHARNVTFRDLKIDDTGLYGRLSRKLHGSHNRAMRCDRNRRRRALRRAVARHRCARLGSLQQRHGHRD